MFKKVVLPASLMAGTVIGAGIFSLPYFFQKAGILIGLFYLTVFAAIFALVHLMYADVILRTKENRRFFGYAKIYLGKWGGYPAILMTIIGMLFILTVYLVLSLSFFKIISPGLVSALGENLIVLVFWLLGSAAIFLNINRLAFSEFLIALSVVFIILAIFGYGLGGFDKIISISFFGEIKYLLLPYGAVLFSLAGRSAVPAVLGYFRSNNESRLRAKTPIILGSLTPALVYAVFILGIFGLSETVSEDSVSGLVGRLPFLILVLIGGLGLISLWSTYIVLGRDIRKSLEHDLNFSLIPAGLIVAVLPLLLYFGGFQNFLKLVGLVGGIFISLESVFIVLMWQKAKKLGTEEFGVFLKNLNPIIIYALLLVFIGGMIYSFVGN